MAMKLQLKPAKTYKTEQRAIDAVHGYYPVADFTFIIACDEKGRFYPICIGEKAAQVGTHFLFITVG